MFELKTFQAKAAHQIATRYVDFLSHKKRPAIGDRPSPFFQALSSMTGSGKTPMLAQAVAEMRAMAPKENGEPIVLWMSKARPVVDQTYINFSAGGKYSFLIEGFRVVSSKELNGAALKNDNIPLLIILTTGVFNNKDKEDGVLNFHQPNEDYFGGASPWKALEKRPAANNKRRPLFVVYDESHNLSEQQTQLLEGMEPDAYLMASATLAFPSSFRKDVIAPYCRWAEKETPETANPERTIVDSKNVVGNSLVKKHVHFDGTTASMELCVDELLVQHDFLKRSSSAIGIKPKAIYVCDTNVVAGEEPDLPGLPFGQRKSPMIRIWKYLVERGVDPKDIAIYTSQLVVDNNDCPTDFNVFGKKEDDFYKFKTGNYGHIIFNKSLQEGWDDPECYLGYIDSCIGSKIRIEQIIGRVLRQPLATHFDTPELNTARFFIRVDKKDTFSEVIEAVKNRLGDGLPEDFINNNYAGSHIDQTVDISPKEIKCLGTVNIELGRAAEKISRLLPPLCSFQNNEQAAVGKAEKTKNIIDIETGGVILKKDWSSTESSTRKVSLRWLISMRVRELSHRVLNITDTSDPMFGRMAEIGSFIDKNVEDFAKKAMSIYREHATLDYNSEMEFLFGASRVRVGKSMSFKNSLFEKYSGLNKLEQAFAIALDNFAENEMPAETILWHRNPSSEGGYKIPLIDDGQTDNFYPDFIVWRGDLVFCLDTKGGHILSDAVRRKLFDIKEGRTTKVMTRFISKGKQNRVDTKSSNEGYTVWKAKNNKEMAFYCDDLDEAVKTAMED